MQGFPGAIHVHGWYVPQKMSKALLRRNKNTDTIMEISVARGQPPFFLRWELVRTTATAFLSTSLVGHFHALPTRVNQWLSNYHINMISSNILSLDSFFSKHRPHYTLRAWLHLVPQSRLLKQYKLISKVPFYVADTSL